MVERLKDMLRTPFSMLPLVAVLIVFTAGLSSYFTVLENKKNIEIVNKIDEQERKREWRSIVNIIEYNMDLYRQNSKVIAMQIENDLRQAYPDLGELEEQMDNNTYDQRFYDSTKMYLYDDQIGKVEAQPYVKTIGTVEHIIAFYTNNKDNTLSKLERDANVESDVKWGDLAELNLNPTLSEKAIKAAVEDQARGVIFTQSSKSSSGAVEKMEDMSITSLKKIYEEHGIDEFKHIDLLAPAYITEEGDIFGNEDSVKGFKKNKTKKMVIIQSVNLFDIIDDRGDALVESRLSIEKSMIFVHQFTQQKIFVSVLLSFVLWSIAIYLIITYNSESRKRSTDEY